MWRATVEHDGYLDPYGKSECVETRAGECVSGGGGGLKCVLKVKDICMQVTRYGKVKGISEVT